MGVRFSTSLRGAGAKDDAPGRRIFYVGGRNKMTGNPRGPTSYRSSFTSSNPFFLFPFPSSSSFITLVLVAFDLE